MRPSSPKPSGGISRHGAEGRPDSAEKWNPVFKRVRLVPLTEMLTNAEIQKPLTQCCPSYDEAGGYGGIEESA